MKNKVNFPTRLGFGKGFVGPDHPGCVNSGHAPAMFKSKLANSMLDKPFMVGGEFAVRFEGRSNVFRAASGLKTKDVRFFKTYKAAKNHFMKLHAVVMAEHAEARKAAEALRKAKPGTPEHMEAALNASDFGLLG